MSEPSPFYFKGVETGLVFVTKKKTELGQAVGLSSKQVQLCHACAVSLQECLNKLAVKR